MRDNMALDHTAAHARRPRREAPFERGTKARNARVFQDVDVNEFNQSMLAPLIPIVSKPDRVRDPAAIDLGDQRQALFAEDATGQCEGHTT